MFKKGFTLSEIIIAAGIVGVIAAAALPQVITNSMKSKTGAVLGRAVNQIEAGCKNVLTVDSENAGDFNNLLALTTGDTNFNTEIIPNYFGARQANDVNAVTTYNGGAYNGIADATYFEFTKIPAGFAIIINNDINAEDRDAIIADIFIDTNGFDTSPNRLGMDVFRFDLSNSGNLIPFGINTFNNLGEDACGEAGVGTGETCAARVVADGFKVNY